MAEYFSYLPDLAYQSFLPGSNSTQNYVLTKNLFRRVKVREDVYNSLTSFVKYEIPDGYRPDNAANDLYGNPDYDWIIITTANIIHLRDEWPLSNYHLYNYAENKYKGDLNRTRFYETTEVRDSKNRLILPAGKVVSENFTIPNPTNPTATMNPVVGVTNYEYETRLNEKKRTIYVLKSLYLDQFLFDMRREMEYTESSQYINDTLIATENTLNKSP